jgi:S1-C subfamily serine protease
MAERNWPSTAAGRASGGTAVPRHPGWPQHPTGGPGAPGGYQPPYLPPPTTPLPPLGAVAPPPGPRRHGRWRWPVVAVAALLGAALIGVGITNAISGPLPQQVGNSTPLVQRSAAGPGGGLDAEAVAAAVDPGLVDVNSTLGYQHAHGAGTGIVLQSSGLILTNNHVIRGATALSVTDIGNGQTYPATVVGYDITDDIAVLQAQGASGLTTARLGDSDSVAVGDQILAIGNAGGTGGTPSVAPGSVTALNRTIAVSDDSGGSARLSRLIQVDADVQPGDSGGPLVNAVGEVVGVDTAAAASNGTASSRTTTDPGSPNGQWPSGPQSPSGPTQNGGSAAGAGEGYAIPINAAMDLAKQITGGSASDSVHIGPTGVLGIGVQDSASTGPGRHRGAVGGQPGATVLNVSSGSPADNAGLVTGDVITAVDGNAVDSASTLTNLLSGRHPGETVQLSWTSATGSQQTTSVQLAAGPAA